MPGDGGASATATFVCGNGHMTAATDVRFSLEQGCRCNVKVNPIGSRLTPNQTARCKQMIPSTMRLLIVTGFGQFHTTNAVYHINFTPVLQRAGIPFDVILAENGPGLTKCLMSNKYSALMFIHLDDKGFQKNLAMFNGDNLGTLYHWILFGGKFILHGEQEYVTQLMQTFTGKPWHYCGDYYRRVKHSCNRKHFRHFPLRSTSADTGAGAGSAAPPTAPKGSTTTDAADSDDDEEAGDEQGRPWVLPKTINMKATMLSGVAVGDRLYNPKPGARVISAVPGFGGHVVNHERTGIAFSPVGQGFLCYVGDVNAEVKTLDTIMTLLRLPKTE